MASLKSCTGLQQETGNFEVQQHFRLFSFPPGPDVISIEPSQDDSSFDDCFPRTPVILTKPLLQWDWQAVTIKKKHPGSHFYQGRINSRNILEVCEHSAFQTNFLKISEKLNKITSSVPKIKSIHFKTECSAKPMVRPEI